MRQGGKEGSGQQALKRRVCYLLAVADVVASVNRAVRNWSRWQITFELSQRNFPVLLSNYPGLSAAFRANPIIELLPTSSIFGVSEVPFMNFMNFVNLMNFQMSRCSYSSYWTFKYQRLTLEALILKSLKLAF